MQRVIERILNLLAFLLTVGRPVTADEIRHTVAGYDQPSDAAFRRTFERDKDLLKSLGVPLRLEHTDAWEVEQGYVVTPSEYALDDPGLTDEERAALWLASRMVHLGGQGPGEGAFLKLGGTPMTGLGDPMAADLTADPVALATVFEAVTDRRRLTFEYRGTPRRLDPYGLLHRGGHWYVVGAVAGERRTFRLDRMEAVAAGSKSGAFQRPADFDVRSGVPDAPWEAGDARLEATIRFDPEVAWWARRQLATSTRIAEDADGGITAVLMVGSPDALIGWLIGFEDAAEIVAPAELRQRFVSHVTGNA
jgi:predicted DNA-binding transcriptional regulator YafY